MVETCLNSNVNKPTLSLTCGSLRIGELLYFRGIYCSRELLWYDPMLMVHNCMMDGYINILILN